MLLASQCMDTYNLIFHCSYCIHHISIRDPSHKSQNTVNKYPTMHHFVWCILGHGIFALWDLLNRSTDWICLCQHTWQHFWFMLTAVWYTPLPKQTHMSPLCAHSMGSQDIKTKLSSLSQQVPQLTEAQWPINGDTILVIIVSGNGLSPVWCQLSVWTSDFISSIGPLGNYCKTFQP